ncbi:MAG: hypothetical protein ACOX5R_01050 [bacterium]|jgi:hypothetical protein
MVVKPGKEEILETYSLRELLDLVEQKSLQNTQDVINDIRDNLASLRFEPEVSNALSTASSTVEKSTQIRSKRNPEPAKAMRQEERLSPASGPGRGRVKGGASLSSLVMSILGSAPKTVDDILGQLEKKGWSTSSADPRGLVYQQLGNLTKKGDVKKVGRGQYARA